MNPFKVFIVEDDPVYAKMLHYHLSLNPDYEVHKFLTGKEFLENLYKNPHVITLDYTLPDIGGFDVLKKIKKHNTDLPVIIISGQEDVSTAVELLKEGAYDYIVKDTETKSKLWNTIKNAKENISLKKEISVLREEVARKYEFNKILKGNSNAIRGVFNLMEKSTKSNITVSISGETGTGKELVAKAIHFNSTRKNRPFVAINVAAVPKELIESEMFGYEKGAFTGATTRRIGRFEEADKGTIFLDEIAEMDLNMQTKLLRVLQEKEISRVGGNAPVKIDVKVIVATNKDLAEEVKNGNFREDLYYRLLGLPIELPPLRNRENDILLLAKHFVDGFCSENKMDKLTISKEAQEKLMNYPFPGNVRELKAVMELSAVMSNGPVVEANDITFRATSSITDFLLKEYTLDEYNRHIIKHFLNKYNNNVMLVANKLDIGKSTIYRMKKNKEI